MFSTLAQQFVLYSEVLLNLRGTRARDWKGFLLKHSTAEDPSLRSVVPCGLVHIPMLNACVCRPSRPLRSLPLPCARALTHHISTLGRPASVVSSRDDGSDDLRAQRRERSTCLPSWNEERGRSAAQPWDKICAEPVKSMGFEGFEVDLAPSEQEERRTKQFDVSP